MLLIVQPWFTAVGHPAQSLINTAKVIGKQPWVGYLVSSEPDRPRIESLISSLEEFGVVTRFKVGSPSIREGTIKALLALRKLGRRSGKKRSQVLFFDAHLVTLAGLWGLLVGHNRFIKVGVIYLMGPERIRRSKIANWLVQHFLSHPGVELFLRTEELTAAWRESFPSVPQTNIRHLPSLEIPDDGPVCFKPILSEQLKFGIIGQIRNGKGIEHLVPLFQQQPNIGRLTVAGEFSNSSARKSLRVLLGFSGFMNTFLSEEAMLQQAKEQDYLLMLYDDWDPRMESAVLYLAARCNRPVISYDKGWSGRQIQHFHCGLVAPDEISELGGFFSALPRPGEEEYQSLLNGMNRFREAHSGKIARTAFLRALRGMDVS